MIKISELGKSFCQQFTAQQTQENWLFRGINLHVLPGESAVVIGPSGSGKSVLLKCIAGLLKPTEGTVTLESENIGMLFQKNALFDSLTVEQNLLFPLEERLGMTGQPARARAKHFLKAVELLGSEQAFPDEISGGMQKRLGIARALIVEPKIILYDEPTAGLDPVTSKTIAEMIINLRKEVGSTLLTVVNDIQRAYQLGDRIFLLALGELYEGGTPEQVKSTQHAGMKQFIYGLKTGPLSQGFA